MPEIISNIENILPTIFYHVRTATIALSVLLFLGIIFFMSKTVWFKESFLEPVTGFLKVKPYKSQKFIKQWNTILDRLKTGNELEFKLAVIEADSLLEKILEKMKFEGETVTDKLTKVPKAIIGEIKGIEKAQEIRNSVVHDPDYQLSLEQAKEVLNIYEKILKQLDV